MTSSLSSDELKQLNQEPGDVTDILQEIPDKETLDNLKNFIETQSPETITLLLKNISTSHNVNTINPLNNKFSTISAKELQRRRQRDLFTKRFIKK